MKTVDVLIVTFAVIALVGSVAGSMLYEPPGQDFQVSFTETEETVRAQETTVSGSAGLPAMSDSDESEIVHNLTQDNITALSFEVTASGASTTRAAAIQVTLTLIAPDGTEIDEQTGTIASSASGFSSPVVFDVPGDRLNEVPEEDTVRADSITAARAQVGGDTTGTNGTGEWTIEVTASFPTLSTGPTGETITITSEPTVTTYAATVSSDLDIGAAA